MKSPGELLKEFRKNNGITGAKLSEILDCSQQYISLVEKNTKKISESKLKILKNIMNEDEYEEIEESVNFHNSPKVIQEKIMELQKEKRSERHEIPYYIDIQASAGYGCFNEESEKEFIEVPREFAKNGNIAINVMGDSMEPEFQNGDIIVVDTKQKEFLENKFIIANYNGTIFLKKLVYDQNNIYLKSINPYYPKIYINDENEFEIIGKVLFTWRKYK